MAREITQYPFFKLERTRLRTLQDVERYIDQFQTALQRNWTTQAFQINALSLTTLGVIGVSRYEDLNTAVDDIGTDYNILVIDASTKLNGDLTIPANILTVFINQGDITGTDTVTFEGVVVDNRHTDGEDKVVAIVPDNITGFPHIGKWINMQRGRVLTPFEFGAKGVGDADDDDSEAFTTMYEASRDSFAKTCDVSGGVFYVIDVRVYSGTTTVGAGKYYPYQLQDGEGYIVPYPHGGDEKAVFWCEPSGSDPHAGEASPRCRSVNFRDITIVSPVADQYGSVIRKGIWFKTDASDCAITNAYLANFSRQCILQERTNISAGVFRLQNVEALGAYADDDQLSDFCAAVELRGAEHYVSNCSFFAGSKQNYVDSTTDLWRTSFLISHNESFVENSVFQFGDYAAVIGAQYSRINNCRFDSAKAHGLLLKKLGTETQPRGVQFTQTEVVQAAVTPLHANNTFDAIHITEGEVIGGVTFDGTQIRSSGSGGTNVRYGLYNGGPAVSATYLTLANRFRGFQSTGHATAHYASAQASQPGPEYDYIGQVGPFNDDTTPTVEQARYILVEAPGGGHTITNFDNGTNGQDIKVQSITLANPITIQNNGTTISIPGGDITMVAGEIYQFTNREGIWYYHA